MPPTIKDISFATEAGPSRSLASNQSASGVGQSLPKTDAVGAEVPVVVHASRYSSAARTAGKSLAPVHEETRTVIIFPNGAVVRVSACMVTGELVVLTNQQTGADVICRVTTVKAQPGMQNYVNLEFTQRAPGFWGTAAQGESNKQAEERSLVFASPPDAVTKAEPPRAVAQVELPAEIGTAPSQAAPVFPSAVENQPIVGVPLVSILDTGSSLGLSSPHTSTPSWGLPDTGIGSTNDSSGARKGILIATAAAVLLGLGVAGGALLFRQNRSVIPVPSAVVSAPVQDAPLPAADAASATMPSQWAPAAEPVQLQTAAINSAAGSRPEGPPTLPAVSQTVPTEPRDIPAQQPSRRPSLSVGMLSAPIAKKSAVGNASVEAPSMLGGASNNAAAASSIGDGLISDALRSDISPSPARPSAPFQPPKVMYSPAPTYPQIALRQHIQGTVVIDALVDAAGNVTSMKVITGPLLLQQAALDVLRKWKYQAAVRDGQLVAAHTQVSIHFQLP